MKCNMNHNQMLTISLVLGMIVAMTGLISVASAIEFEPHDEHTIHMHPPHIPETSDSHLAPDPVPFNDNQTISETNSTK
jgi:hypothetical protein